MQSKTLAGTQPIRIGVAVIANVAAGKQTIFDNMARDLGSTRLLQISSGAICATDEEAKVFYQRQKPAPSRIYYPMMRREIPALVLPEHEVVFFDGVFRSRRDMDELYDTANQVIDRWMVIELITDDDRALVKRGRGRKRDDFNLKGFWRRIRKHKYTREEVLLGFLRRGAVYGVVDATKTREAVYAEFLGVYGELRQRLNVPALALRSSASV